MTMLRSILVGLDGSPCSGGAIELGLDWARRFNALLVGVGVVDEPAIRRPAMMPIGGSSFKEHADEALLRRATLRVEQILEAFALRCVEAGVPSKLLEVVGDPAEQILREAQRYDLLLLGTQTHFHFSTQETPCETLTKVLHSTPRPVVAAPEKLGNGGCVVVAYDGSLQAARALRAFQCTGLGTLLPVHVLCISDDHVEAARHTDRAVEFLGFHDINATPHAVPRDCSDTARPGTPARCPSDRHGRLRPAANS
jgi:nucleotide-binding universal stress UspA family protein